MLAAGRTCALLLLSLCVLGASIDSASGMMVERWNFATRNCTGAYAVVDVAAVGQCQGSSGFYFAYSSCDASWLYQYQHPNDATCGRASRATLPETYNTYTCRLAAEGSYLLACEGIPRPSTDPVDSSTGGADPYTSSGSDGGADSSSSTGCQDFECAAAALAPSAIIAAALVAAARVAL